MRAEPRQDLGSARAMPTSPKDRDRARTKTLAALGQSVWEATQYLTYDEVGQYVESVLREVESDEP